MLGFKYSVNLKIVDKCYADIFLCNFRVLFLNVN